MGRERNLIVDKRLKDFTPVTRIKGEVNRQGIKVNGQSYMSYRNSFEQYLLDHTILERASTSKHDYMKLYEKDGEMFMKLNLQIQFK
ncbi:Modification methylase HpaII [Clostridiales bacterium CHKCI001]|nr:Modification methylase HpaII [Clostridiales bacterium CHKCI001]